MSDVTIMLEMKDDTPIQMAYAICKHYVKVNEIYQSEERVFIQLEELAEHILSVVKSESKQNLLMKGMRAGNE